MLDKNKSQNKKQKITISFFLENQKFLDLKIKIK